MKLCPECGGRLNWYGNECRECNWSEPLPERPHPMTQPAEKTTCPDCGSVGVRRTYELLSGGHLLAWQCGTEEHVSGSRMRGVSCYETELAALKAQLAAATETYTAPDGEVWSPPTAEAYYLACQALKVRRERLAEAEKERDENEAIINQLCDVFDCNGGELHRRTTEALDKCEEMIYAATARAEAAEKELEALKERIAATGELVRTGKHCRMAEHMTDSCDCGEITAEYDALLAQPEGGSDGK